MLYSLFYILWNEAHVLFLLSKCFASLALIFALVTLFMTLFNNWMSSY
jgi:hypothetical protein